MCDTWYPAHEMLLLAQIEIKQNPHRNDKRGNADDETRRVASIKNAIPNMPRTYRKRQEQSKRVNLYQSFCYWWKLSCAWREPTNWPIRGEASLDKKVREGTCFGNAGCGVNWTGLRTLHTHLLHTFIHIIQYIQRGFMLLIQFAMFMTWDSGTRSTFVHSCGLLHSLKIEQL